MAICHYHATNRWTTTIERIFPYPAGYVNGTMIPLSRYRKEVAARKNLVAKNKLNTTDAAIQKSVMERLVNGQLYQQALTSHTIVITDSDVDTSLNNVYKQIGGQANLEKFLTDQYGDQMDLADFRLLTREYLAESAVEKQLLVQADVKHLLIAVPAGASEADVNAAKARASDVRSKISDAASFGDAVKQHSEDTASRDKGGNLGTTTRGDVSTTFSADFEKAIFSLPVGQVSDPVRSKLGWHLLLITKRTGSVDLSLDDYLAKLHKDGHIRTYVGS